MVQRPFWQAWTLLLLGLVGTAVVVWETRKELELTAKKQFQSACNEIQIKINDRFKAHELILRSGVAFYENSGGGNRLAWRAFAAHQQLEQLFPGVQGLGFSLLIPREQLARHLQEIRAEGFPEYQVRPEGERAVYSAIIYLEPFTNRNLRAFGYDMLSEPVRREAMERARDNDAAALSGKVTLVQENGEDVQAGTLMFVPVYRLGMAHATVAQRRDAIVGWVCSPYRMNDLMRGILGNWEWMVGQRIRLQVFDGGQKLSPEALIFDSHPDAAPGGRQNALLNMQSRFVAAGRSWVLSFTPDGHQAAALDYGRVWIILVCGVSLSLMLFRLETLMLAARASAREMQLLIETNPDNVILKDGKGRWMVANEPAKKLFQLGDDDAWRGKTDAELAEKNPRLRMFHEACINSDEQTWKGRRHCVVTEQGVGPDGKLQEHEVYKTPVFSPGGKRQGLVIIGRDMTSRRQMERNLRFSEAMASQSRDIILRLRNADGRILDANAAAESNYGYSRAELLAKTIYDLREKTDAAISSQQMSLAFGQGILYETVHVRKDGSRLPVEVSSQGVQLEGEACIISVIRDISARKKIEKRLQQLETAVAASATGIFLADRHGCITWANAAFSRLTGYANEEVMGCTPRFLNSGRHSDEFYKKMWGTILAGNVWKGELENRRKDGTIYFENKTITPVLDEAGKVSQFICVQEDVTRQKQAEAALIAANNFANNKSAQLKSILESPQNVVIFSLDASYCYTEFTQTHQATIKQIRGVDIAVGMNLLDIISDPADRAKAKANFDRVLRGESFLLVEEYGDPSRQRTYYEDRYSPIFGNGGVVVGITVFVIDITERRRAEHLLVMSEHKFRRLFETVTDGIVSVDLSGQIQEFNPAYAQMLGYSDEELLRLTYKDVTPEKWHAIEAGIVTEQVLPRGFSEIYEKEYRRKEGTVFPVELRTFVIKDAVGQVAGMWATVRDITVRKKAETQLRISEERYREVVDTARDLIFTLAPDGTFNSVNPVVEVVSGVEVAHWIGKSFAPLVHPDDLPQAWEKLQCILKGEPVPPYELRGHPDLPRSVIMEITVFARKDGGGNIVGVMGIGRDITERKRAEAEIVKARDFHLQLLQNAPTLIWRAGTDAKCDWFNSTWLAFTGRTLVQEHADGWAEGVHPEDLASCVEKYLAAFHKREAFSLEYRLRRHDGEYRWISDHGRPFDLPGGGFGGYIGYCYDIHEGRQAHELLEQRVAERTREIAMLSEVIDQSSVAFSMSNPDGSFISVNEAYARLTGYSRAEILSRKLKWSEEMTPPEWRPISAEKLDECLRTRQAVNFEKEYLRKDGGRVPVELFVQPIYGEDDKLIHLRAFVMDITKRKQAEEALRQALARERTLAEVIDSSEMAFCMGTPDGRLTLINQAFERLTGYSRQELQVEGFSWIEKLTPVEWRETETLMVEECIRARKPARYEKEYIHKDGRRFPVELFVQPIFDDDGRLMHLRAFVSDISERKKNAEELGAALLAAGRASRAKSEFLATMSHEIRTPMNIILGNAQLLQREAGLSKEVQNKLVTINRSGEHLLSILNDILDLAKIESGRMEVHLVEFKLNEFLDNLFSLFHPPARARQLAFTIKKGGWVPESIRADQQKIRQILSNLLGNAVKFTKTGGIELKVSAKPDAGNKVWLNFAVTDSGPGIAPDELSHVFEKFHQGKLGRQSESGSGLGLAICQEYARLMQGRMSVQSELGKGSMFQFEVPVGIAFDAAFNGLENIVKDNQFPANASGYRILIVDDVAGNREVLQEMVETAGFDCRTAVNGAEALEIFAAWQPHMILMDTRMPVMGGLEAIRRIRAADQGQPVKIISISATAYAEDRADAQTAGADYFISKPLKYDELIFRISGALGLDLSPEIEFQKSGSLHPAGSDNGIITSQLLAALPGSWGYELREALLAADAAKIAALIKAVEPHNPEAAKRLVIFAGQFDYERILEQLDKSVV
ncbi:MAG: PAS domain S-box protein [Verrucomicrobiota bacterium]